MNDFGDGGNIKGNCVIGGGGVRRIGNYRISANISSHAELSWRLNQLTEGAFTILKWEVQYFITRIERDNFLRRRRLGLCRTLKGWPLTPGRTGGIKKRLGSRSNPQENTLHTAMRSPRRRRLFYECRHSHSSCGRWWKPFTSLVANLWICSKQSASATRFGEQACKAYSKWGRINEQLHICKMNWVNVMMITPHYLLRAKNPKHFKRLWFAHTSNLTSLWLEVNVHFQVSSILFTHGIKYSICPVIMTYLHLQQISIINFWLPSLRPPIRCGSKVFTIFKTSIKGGTLSKCSFVQDTFFHATQSGRNIIKRTCWFREKQTYFARHAGGRGLSI